MRSQLAAAHSAARAKFEKLAGARQMLDKARVELTKLAELGDLVTSEDVIKGAGKLVGEGLSPMAMAKMLSDMPEGGPQLSGWLGQQSQMLAAREAQLQPVLDSARHQMGVAAMRSLVGEHLGSALAPPPAAAPGVNYLLSPNASEPQAAAQAEEG